MSQKLKIVFFGTPEFAVASLDRLVADGQNIAAVVTMPDKIGGRGHKVIESDVKKYAREKGLRILQPEKLRDPGFIETLREINADLFVVIAFRMMPEAVWSMPRFGTFNLHGSLLPKYRGAAPINHAIINGEKETGVTTFFIDRQIDTGDIIDCRKITIEDDDDAGTVHDKLMILGAEMTAKTVADIASGSMTAKPQPEGEFTPAPKIFKDTCRIDWTAPSVKIHNLVRGLSPYPAAWTVMHDANGKNHDIKVYKTALSDVPTAADHTPGKVMVQSGRLYVATADGWIEILSLMPAGKRRMEASAFLLGYKPEKCLN